MCCPFPHGFIGLTGTVIIDNQGDRDPDYWMWSFGPGKEAFEPMLKIQLAQPLGDGVL